MLAEENIALTQKVVEFVHTMYMFPYAAPDDVGAA